MPSARDGQADRTAFAIISGSPTRPYTCRAGHSRTPSPSRTFRRVPSAPLDVDATSPARPGDDQTRVAGALCRPDARRALVDRSPTVPDGDLRVRLRLY